MKQDGLRPDRHVSPLGFFLKVDRSELWWFALNNFLYSCGSLSMLAASYYLGKTIDALTRHAGEAVAPLVGLLLLSVVFYEVGYRLGHICEIIVLSRMRAHIKKALFDHTASLSFGYFADRFAGELAHKVAKTADAFERMVIVTSNGFIEGGLLIVVSAAALGAVHPLYGIFMMLWGLIFATGSYFLAKRMHLRASVYAATEAKTTGAIVDTYANIATVKVYGKSDDFKKTHEQIEAEAKAFMRLGVWDVITYSYQGVSIIVLTALLIGITAFLYTRSIISLGEIVFVATAALRLFNFVWETGKNLVDFIRFRGEAAQNLKDLIAVPAILDGRNVFEKQKEVSVEYRNVVFGYMDGRPVLDRFSLAVRPGEKVGIVGLSGAGKTTFANLLLRFFDPQGGTIFLNGVDIKDVPQEELRSHISYISQDTALFHATVAENIAYGVPVASEGDIRKAAHLAFADEFIEKLPNGYASVVGDRGIKLSGGQRQRIAIARAILADRPLFLLDEATSALDSESEKKIQQGLARLMESKTVIAIAHRLSTLSHMNRIIFLEGGAIVEDGTHEELLSRGAKYAALWHMQAGGFLPADADI